MSGAYLAPVVSAIALLNACHSSLQPARATAERAGELLVVLTEATSSGRSMPFDADALCMAWAACEHYGGLRDGWGTRFMFSSTSPTFTLRSAGRDRRNGTDDDIDFSPSAWRTRAEELAGCWIRAFGPRSLFGDTLSFSHEMLASTAMRGRVQSSVGTIGWAPWTRDSIRAFWVSGALPRDLWLELRGDTLRGDLRYALGEWGPRRRATVMFARDARRGTRVGAYAACEQ